MSEQNRPATRIQLFPVSAIVWKNVGPKSTNYSVTFERTYKDQSGQYQTSTSFSGTELLLVSKAADLAHSEILKLRESDRKTDQSEDEAA